MSDKNIFEEGCKLALRFSLPKSAAGATIEDLYTLQLSSNRATVPTLFGIGNALAEELKTSSSQMFGASVEQNNVRKVTELKLAIVKHIIEERQADNASKVSAAEIKKENQVLIDALAESDKKAISNLTPEQIKAKIAENTAKLNA